MLASLGTKLASHGVELDRLRGLVVNTDGVGMHTAVATLIEDRRKVLAKGVSNSPPVPEWSCLERES
eukprot:1825583-Amphidinium_carterae.1